MTKQREAHFAVDKEGLAKLLERKGKHFAIYELIQNAWDEDSTQVDVHLTPTDKPGRYRLIVTDDDPDGFTDLAHAYTLFAESEKKLDPEKRGRFNLGEKLVLAICDEATINTTTGTVYFDGEGRWQTDVGRESGSVFTGIIRMTKREAEKVGRFITSLIPPEGIETTFNGKPLVHRRVVREFQVSLPTELADDEGRLVERVRKGKVRLFNVNDDEKPMLYELGIPVQRIDTRWHVDVGQKVPLTMDREAAKPSYVSAVKAEVLNHAHDILPDDEGGEKWLTEALESKRISPEAAEAAMTAKYGEKRVIFDPSDLEANRKAAAQGYTVIGARGLSKEAHAKVRELGLAQAAGKVTPSNSTYVVQAGDSFPEAKVTEGMAMVRDWSKAVADRLLGREIQVQFVNDLTGPAAAYGSGLLVWNVGTLGYRWFDEGQCVKVNDLLIHELAHEYASNHLDESYYRALTRLGAQLAQLALDEPEAFQAHAMRGAVAA